MHFSFIPTRKEKKLNFTTIIVSSVLCLFIATPCIGETTSEKSTPQKAGGVKSLEKRIQDLFCRLDLKKRIFSDFSDLQLHIDEVLSVLENEWSCGATGLSIAKSFEYEKQYLQPLPDIFPALPVAEKRTVVRRDGTVYFAGNYYQVPQIYIDKQVLCLHTGQQMIGCYDLD